MPQLLASLDYTLVVNFVYDCVPSSSGTCLDCMLPGVQITAVSALTGFLGDNMYFS